MKKSTILMLLIVFVGSVLVVGIFGMQSVPYEQILYVKEIVPTSVTSMSSSSQNLQIQTDGDGYYVMLPYEEGLQLLINYKLDPVDCTNKGVRVSIVSPDNPPAELTDRNVIVFNRKGVIKLRYSPMDSATTKPMEIRVFAY